MTLREFGELEAVVMAILWDRTAPTTVRSVHDELKEQRQIAYTTVMSTMDNLFRKGWLDREKAGLAYQYTPKMSREEHTAHLMHTALESGGDCRLILNFFLDRISADESTNLRRALRSHPKGPQ